MDELGMLAARQEVDELTTAQEKVVSNGDGGMIVDQSQLLKEQEQQEQLRNDKKELEEGVTVLRKKLEDLKLQNNVQISLSLFLCVIFFHVLFSFSCRSQFILFVSLVCLSILSDFL